MKILKRILLLVLILIAVLAAAAFLLPGSYNVERTTTINAKPKAIYPFLADLRKWPDWTAWNKTVDPTMSTSFSGAEEGAGAIYEWRGEKVGRGKMTLTRADAEGGIRYDLSFDEGKYFSQGGITLEKTGDTTKVTWFNGGKLGNNPINRYFGLAMDKMMGPDFARGLENLKLAVEARK
jgi:hypothetical protein